MGFGIELEFLVFGVLAGLLGSAAVLLLLSKAHRRPHDHPDTAQETTAFLFHGESLVDATPSAQGLIGDVTHLGDVVAVLAARFPGLRKSALSETGTTHIGSDLKGDDGFLELSQDGDTLKVVLNDPANSAADRHQFLMTQTRLDNYDKLLDQAPIAMWATDSEGALRSGNHQYHQLVAMGATDTPFEKSTEADLGTHPRRRASLTDVQTDKVHWYDLYEYAAPDGGLIHYAVNADAIVTAEAAQRNFVQTLTKTFAHLSIGLAIFDRKRQLALFNPALIDLTQLPADFLSGRPSLGAFFDQLRDRQIMPEPRNYKNWRDQLSDMLAAAQDGQYCETWTLPSGLTYRINGKPHPDGAVAFLFEDISAEISLTRRFRSELELSQSVLDAMDCAIAVFSRNGTLTFSNKQFRDVWKCSPDESFIEMTVVDVSRIWQEACEPSGLWGEIRDFVGGHEERAEWSETITHRELGPMQVTTVPVGGRATMVRFALHTTAEGGHREDVAASDTI